MRYKGVEYSIHVGCGEVPLMAVSLNTPRFCLAAKHLTDANEKAKRAIDFWQGHRSETF